MSEPKSVLDALSQVVDVMRRADPDYCLAHGVEQVSDEQWDAAIEAAEDALDAPPPAAIKLFEAAPHLLAAASAALALMRNVDHDDYFDEDTVTNTEKLLVDSITMAGVEVPP